MVNIAIFASGNGSNFENIVNEIENGHVYNAVCKVLIIDKEGAYAKERAAKLNIPCVYVNPKGYGGKEEMCIRDSLYLVLSCQSL